MDIVFNRRQFTHEDPITGLRSRKAIDKLTHDVLKLVFNQGGWVAGGFARIVAHYYVLDNEDVFAEDDELENNDLCRAVDRHLDYGTPCDIKDPYRKFGKGDIDVFFEHQRQIDNFWRALQATGLKNNCKLEASVSGAAQEISINNCVRLQVIERYKGPIEDQLRSFDIFNAMCAFNDKQLLFPEGWDALERELMLHVQNWTSPFIISRVTKWCYRHGYTKLSPKTATEIGDVAMNLIQSFKEKPYSPAWGGPPMTHETIIKKMKRFLPQLTNDQLLLMTSVYPLDAYQGPLDVLRKRAGI